MNNISMQSVSFKGVPETTDTENQKKMSSQEIQEKADEFTKTVNTVADSVDKTADSVVSASTKVAGSVAAVRVGFTKLIPKPILEFFTKDGTEKIIDKETGKEVFKKVANWKHIGIAAGGIAALAAGIIAYKGIKNHIEHKQKLELINAKKDNPEKEVTDKKIEDKIEIEV